MVTVPGKAISTLVPALSDPAKAAAAWESVLQMIARDEATLLANLVAEVADGGQAESSSVEEFRYGTEFEPPQLPTLLGPDAASLEVLKNWPLVGITPTAFDTRKVGAMMQVGLEAIPLSQAVRCHLTLEHTRFERYEKFDAGHLVNNERLTMEQPIFSSFKNEQTLTLEPGLPRLAGVHRLTGERPLFELFVVTVRRLNASAP